MPAGLVVAFSRGSSLTFTPTDWQNADSDGDGASDTTEINGGSDALVADQGSDTDGPGVTLYTPDEDQTVGY